MRFDAQGSVKDLSIPLTGADREYLDALYDGSLRYVDRQLGKLFTRLEELDRLDSSLIVITSDHGESLLEVPGRWSHGNPWYEKEARIPLIVHYPRRISPGVRPDFAEAVDVMPTILDLLGVDPPAAVSMDGIALMSDPTRKEFAMYSTGIRDRRYKLLFLANEDQVSSAILKQPTKTSHQGLVALFDLEADPGEIVDVAGENQDTVARLLTLYREKIGPLFARYEGATTSEPPKSAFAIVATYFEVAPNPTRVPDESSMAEASATATPTGWIRSLHWDRAYLLAHKAAQPVEVRFPLPSATYGLRMFVSGSVDILPEGASRPERVSSDVPAGGLDPWSVSSVDIGEITVKDDEFRATLTPVRGAGPVLIRMFSFTPKNGNEVSREDADRLKRLRSLGYAQ